MFVQILGLNIDHFPRKMPYSIHFMLKFVSQNPLKNYENSERAGMTIVMEGAAEGVGGFLKTCCFEKHHQSAVLTV